METMLIIDVNYLAYRSFHVFGGLKYDEKSTGVTYGVLKELQTLKDLFQTDNFIFCFDHGRNKRELFYKGYKQQRNKRKKEPELKEKIKAVRTEVKNLKFDILPKLGYRNVFYQDGYEADDMIAISSWNPHKNIIISADQDLFQLINKRTSIWNPHKKEMMTQERFMKEYGIIPIKWIEVKALAGCSTDEIPGCEGVGETKAISFIKNEMNPDTATYQKCKQFIKSKDYERNLKLVTLPFFELKSTELMCEFKANKTSGKKWNKVVKKLGMKSFLNKEPHFKG